MKLARSFAQSKFANTHSSHGILSEGGISITWIKGNHISSAKFMRTLFNAACKTSEAHLPRPYHKGAMGRTWQSIRLMNESTKHFGSAVSTTSSVPVAKEVDLPSLPVASTYSIVTSPPKFFHAHHEILPKHESTATMRGEWLERPNIILMVKKDFDRESADVAKRMASWIKETYGDDVMILVEPSAAAEFASFHTYNVNQQSELGRVVDCVITIGGDGSVLHVSSLFQQRCPPIISFSTGSLGFLLPFSIYDYKSVLTRIFSEGFTFTPRLRLMCQLINPPGFQVKQDEDCKRHSVSSILTTSPEDAPWSNAVQVMNDVSLHRGDSAQPLKLNCFINERPLTKTWGDGVVVATPTGSTAYSLSAGGSMVHPAIQSILLTPICPMSLSFRPALLPKDAIVQLKVLPDSRCQATVSIDGQKMLKLSHDQGVQICASPYGVPTVTRDDAIDDWVLDINELLRWNQSPYPRPRRGG